VPTIENVLTFSILDAMLPAGGSWYGAKPMAKTPNRIKVTLLFPLFDNDGNPFDRETWRWWQREMKKLDVDFSELGLAGGVWRGQKDR
jgi:hypothetical protein